MTTIVAEWAEDQNFCHPDPSADEDTKREWDDRHDRLMFAIDQIAERVEGVHNAFRAWRISR